MVRTLFFVTSMVCYAIAAAIPLGLFVMVALQNLPLAIPAAVVTWPIAGIIVIQAVQLIAYELFERRVFTWMPNTAIRAHPEVKLVSVVGIWSVIGYLAYLYATTPR